MQLRLVKDTLPEADAKIPRLRSLPPSAGPVSKWAPVKTFDRNQPTKNDQKLSGYRAPI